MNIRLLQIETLANWLLFLTLFFLTLWRFGSNQLIAITALLVFIYRPWRRQLFRWQHFKQPIILWTLLFFLWMVISLSYSEAPCWHKALQGLTMYSKLLFLLVIPLTMAHSKCRYWVEQGLIWGVFVNVVISTLNYYHVAWVGLVFGPYFSLNGVFSINPLQLIFIVVLACWILSQRLITRQYHVLDIVLFILLSIYLWFINIERSGYLLYLTLLIVLLCQYCNKKSLLLSLLAVIVLCFGLYELSPNVKARIQVGINNINAFNQVQNINQIGVDNSLGLRLAFTKVSLEVVKAHPLLGTGIGSFKYVYANLTKSSNIPNDPHDAYTLVAFELGLIGLALYIIWLISIFCALKKLPKNESRLLAGLWWALVIFGFTDSGLILNAVGLSFVMLLSLYGRQELKG